MAKSIFFLFTVALATVACALTQSMPSPFTRVLTVSQPYLTGNDVTIAQTLVKRDAAVDASFTVNGVYDEKSAKAFSAFQSANGLKASGTMDAESAQALLNLHSADGYKDSGFTAGSLGYLYKIHIPVHSNRSVETYATLYDKDNNVLLKFRAREHGNRGDGTTTAWPNFGDGDVGLNEFSSSGNTPTGLVEIDLNSPEPNPDLYGPWPVNRFVRGLEGNAALMLPNIRDGVLLHTGNWSTPGHPWTPEDDMPNSSGCIHAHPADIEAVYNTLVKKVGAVVNPNTYSGKNYPYKPQGIAVVELID